MADLKLKYHDEIKSNSLTDCPPKDALSKDIEAYRFVNEPITNADFQNYMSLGKIRRGTEASHHTCARFGLSMFASIDGAKSSYKTIPNKNTFKYTHIAKGNIGKGHGICTSINNRDHFTLHEFTGVKLEESFNIVDGIK